MKNPVWHAVFLFAATTLLASCADSSSEPAADTEKYSEAAPSSTSAGDDTVFTTPREADPRASEPAVAAAIANAAEREGVDVVDVNITSLKQVTWRDGSIGCPRPGMQYSQALVEGQQLILSLASDPGQSFTYHAGSRGGFTYCESPQPPLEGAPGST